MDIMLIKSRYKIAQILHAETDYAAFLAVDIESREKTEYLLNVYEGALGKSYADCYEALQHCPEYAGMFLTDGALVAVFAYKEASDIDSMFYKGAEVDWRTRLSYAQHLFHLALSVSDFPPEIGCTAFLTRNLRVLPKDMKLAVNYMVRPIDGANSRELIYMLSDQVRKVLIRRYYMSDLELDFVESLESGALTSVTAIYSQWQEVLRDITAEYEAVYAMSGVQRAIHFTLARIKRWFRKRKRPRR